MSKAINQFKLMDILDFNAEKEYHEGRNEYEQTLAVFNFDEVNEGYKLFFYRIECENTTPSVYYECGSNYVGSSRNLHKSLEDMCDMYDEWINEERNQG